MYIYVSEEWRSTRGGGMQRRSFVARVIFGVTTRERVSVTLLIRLGIVGNIVVCSANGRRGIRATTCNDIVFRGARFPCPSLSHILFYLSLSLLFTSLSFSFSVPLSRPLSLSLFSIFPGNTMEFDDERHRVGSFRLHFSMPFKFGDVCEM